MQIDSYRLFAAKPFERSTETRDFLDAFIQTTARAANHEVEARAANGEDRDSVISDYISDEAFEAWYADFTAGLQAAVGN